MPYILLAALAATAPGPIVRDVVVNTSPPVPCNAKLQPAKGAPRPGVHPLAQEPNAAAIRPVLRMVDGCPEPVLIREDIGSRPKRRGRS